MLSSMFYLNSIDVECMVVLELPHVEVVEAHLVQLLDGDGVVDLCAEFLDHDVGSELLMSSSLQFVYEDVVDAPLQVVPAIFDVQVVHLRVVLEDDRIHIVDALVHLFVV